MILSRLFGCYTAHHSTIFHFLYFSLQVMLNVRRRVLSELLNDEALQALAVTRESVSNYLGLRVRDTCSSSLLGVIQALDMEKGTTGATFTTKLKCNTGITNRKNADIPVYSVVGPASSKETAAISPLLSSRRISHISNWASSSEFNSRKDYPYLFRTVPTVNYQAKAIADLVEMFGWRYLALVYSDDVLYGVEGSQFFDTEAESRAFCLPVHDSFSIRDRKKMRRTVQKLAADTKIKAIVLFALLEDVVPFLSLMGDANITDRVLIGSDDWINRLDYTDLPSRIAKLFYTNRISVLGFSPRPINSGLAQTWIDNVTDIMQTPELLKDQWNEDPFLRPFLEDRLKCSLNTTTRYLCPDLASQNRYRRVCSDSEVFISPVPNMEYLKPFVLAIEIAIRATLLAIFDAASKKGVPEPTASDIFCQLIQLQMPCGEKYFIKGGGNPARKSCPAFTETGSARPVYTVQNLQISGKALPTLTPIAVWSDLMGNSSASRMDWFPDAVVDWRNGSFAKWSDSDSWPVSRCSSPCPPGNMRVFNDPTLILCCWECRPCGLGSISNVTNSDSCRRCPLGYRANRLSSECEEIEPNYLDQTNGWIITVQAISYLGVLIALTTLFLLWKWRISPLVRASDLRLTTAILISMVAGCLLTALLTGRPTDDLCKAQLLLITPWPTFAVSGVLCKTNRFAQIFSQKTFSRGRRRRKLLGTPLQFAFMVALTTVQILITIFGVVFATPTAKKVYTGTLSVDLVCDWNTGVQVTVLSYNLLLILICLVLAYRTRKLPENYNEARLIFMAAFCVLVVWLGLSPAYFVTASQMQPVISALSVSVVFYAIWTCLYAPRLYVLVRHKDKRTRRQSSIKRITAESQVTRSESLAFSLNSFSDNTVSAQYNVRKVSQMSTESESMLMPVNEEDKEKINSLSKSEMPSDSLAPLNEVLQV